MTLNMTELEREVASDEGFMPIPYRCTSGKLSIGYGTNIQDGITREEALLLMRHRLGKVVAALESRLPFWPNLSPERKHVLANMGYQLGITGLLGFRQMLAALERGDYEAAAREMLDSKWAKRDTPGRAGRLAERMRRG